MSTTAYVPAIDAHRRRVGIAVRSRRRPAGAAGFVSAVSGPGCRRWAVFVALLLAPAWATIAQTRYVPGRILVKPRTQLSETDFGARLRGHGLIHLKSLHRINVRVLKVPETRAEAVLGALRRDPGIEFAERDGLAKAAFVPNDPYVLSGQEWHLGKIEAPQAWELGVGANTVVVAILDSGVNAAHPDLAGRVLPGYDFLSGNTDTSDGFGHGTAVAGVVAAAGNNGVGVAGVASGCSLLPIKVVDASGFAAYSTVALGIHYAVDHGARIINLSLAGSSPSSTLQDAISDAWSNNVVVVAAAGNNANNVPQYPAACDHVVAVSATEPDDSLASFSSFGTHVGLAAPGDNIWTTCRDLSNPYAAWRGTSFSSPVVAAVAALVASANPALSNGQIVSVLEQAADDIGPAGHDVSFGYGRVNAFRALSAVVPPNANPPAAPDPPPAPADTAAPSVQITLSPPAGARLSVALVSLAGTASDDTAVDRVEVRVNDAPNQFALGTSNWSAQVMLAPGFNTVQARSVDRAGHVSPAATRTFTCVVKAPLAVQTNGWGKVEPDLNGRMLEIGKAYQVKAVPGPGQIFAGWSTAGSTLPTLSFVMQSNLALVANFVPTPFRVVKGTYTGLAAATNGVAPVNASYFALSVTSMGRFTGRLFNGGQRHGFAGRFDLSGNAVVSVPRGHWRAPLALRLHVDLAPGSDTVCGSVSDGAWVAELNGDRNIFNAQSNPARQAGQRSFVLERASQVSEKVAAGLSRIASSGATRVRGKLSDGRSFGAASTLAKNGDYPFYLSLNHGREVVIGWLNFPAGPAPTASGTVLWVGSGTNAFAATLQAAAGPE